MSNKDKMLTLRLSKEEYSIIKGKAKKAGISMSALILNECIYKSGDKNECIYKSGDKEESVATNVENVMPVATKRNNKINSNVDAYARLMAKKR